MKIIAIGGTDGSGKDSLGNVLADKGWLFVSVTDLLRAEAKKQGLPLSRPVLRQISTKWRQEGGLGVLVDKAVAVFEPQESKYKGLAIASLRNPGEVDRVHELGGTMVWIDADPQIRYKRVISRMRGSEDQVTFEQFLAEEQEQMHYTGNDATLSLSGVKAKADIFITNDNNDLAEFAAKVQKALNP